MGYSVQNVSGIAADLIELSEFLAEFVRDGELSHPLPGDDQAEVWQQRFLWWWDENPFCRADSPRGFVLSTDDGEIVGFSGFIPMDYTVNAEVVPSLVATTFFVRKAHRSAVMGMLARQRALGRDYHMIDGSPSPEMRHLLDRLGYEKAGKRYQYYFPLTGFGGAGTQRVLEKAGLSISLPTAAKLSPSHYLATSLEEVETIPSTHDAKLRRQVTRESLEWLCQVGSEPRSFFGYCDEKGELIAYVIGLYKRKYGLCFCLLQDYRDFRPDDDGLGTLIRMMMDDPIGSGLARDTDALALSVFGEDVKPPQRGVKRDSILYYHLPNGIDPRSKNCLAIEGDLALI